MTKSFQYPKNAAIPLEKRKESGQNFCPLTLYYSCFSAAHAFEASQSTMKSNRSCVNACYHPDISCGTGSLQRFASGRQAGPFPRYTARLWNICLHLPTRAACGGAQCRIPDRRYHICCENSGSRSSAQLKPDLPCGFHMCRHCRWYSCM